MTADQIFAVLMLVAILLAGGGLFYLGTHVNRRSRLTPTRQQQRAEAVHSLLG